MIFLLWQTIVKLQIIKLDYTAMVQKQTYIYS